MDDNRWHKKTGPGQIMAQYTYVLLSSGLLEILEVSFSTGFCRKVKTNPEGVIDIRVGLCINPSQTNISMHILHTVRYTFRKVLTRRT